MAQLLLPLFHKGSIEIGNNMYYKKENGRVTYFQGIMPFFHHAEEDLQSFRRAHFKKGGKIFPTPYHWKSYNNRLLKDHCRIP